jgi:ring-1,2-phenylacetyl-CoA epoxidase subunit PaaB
MEEREERLEYGVYEVFVQKTQQDHHQHVGSVVAPSPDVALITARENFLRRDPAVNIWVVPREHIYATPYEGDYFARELDRRYREVSGYSENGRLWRMFKERAMDLDEMIRFVEAKEAERRSATSAPATGSDSRRPRRSRT